MWRSCERVRKALFIHAVMTRVVIFLLQFIFSVFDFSTDAFKGLQENDNWARRMFRGLMRWDSIQFLHVAEHGYTYEHSLAFFPFFPTLISAIAHLLSTVSMGLMSYQSSLPLAAVLLNFVTFILSLLLIYDISLIITSSEKIAHISSLLFSVNPASIFFSSIYTESLYCFLSMLGIRLLLSSRTSSFILLPTTILFCSAFLTRSNGFLNIGYLIFYGGLRLIGREGDTLWSQRIHVQIRKIGLYIIKTGLAMATIMLALRIHSVRQINRFCSGIPIDLPQSIVELGQRENLTIVGTSVSWCSDPHLIYPPFYSSIQSHYWDVSLFGYWQINKIPCFLLAAPALIFTFYCAIRVLIRLHLQGVEWMLNSHGDVLPFAVHTLVLAIPALLIYNVEVFTRIAFSSSPFLYIELARIISEQTPKVNAKNVSKPRVFPLLPYLLYRRDICCVISLYFFTYFFMGTIMHSSFLPFT